ncbi:NUDIX domain-containing protein [Paracoccus lutimaris]|uniref:ADP-ribose pyrophosphatase YjhB (NUDIX family) n=1 Tax=Paracoccus lutimaris TaxID=1490030 RepID=A0A368YL61_9RHOB|nr:NUDIX domain-containing protein [Paracoccus lutimaris]RCW80258.1 ADP-ribose pyrophosphatase YjhB (NUDIX family) [Paracoccus lutimaris]
MRITERQAARAILLTPANEVLLMRVEVQNGSFWICPGGGLQADETAPRALERELTEELALEGAQIGPLLWKRCHEMTLYGRRWRQSEDYFVVPVSRFTPRMQDAAEARILREFRWWRLDELRHSTEAIVPQSLLRIILDFRESGPPREPLEVEMVTDQPGTGSGA